MVTTFEDRIKIYITPILIGILGWIISSTLNEVKVDLKLLLNHDASNSEKIRFLESELNNIKRQIERATKKSTSKVDFYEGIKPKTLVVSSSKIDWI